eukprot:1848-Heterococcus_DN1.PRE.2
MRDVQCAVSQLAAAAAAVVVFVAVSTTAVQRDNNSLSIGPGKATMKSCMLHSSGMCTAKSLIIL